MTAPTGPFFRRGVTRFVFCPIVTNLAVPTRAQITAGTVLRGITNVSGFAITRSFVDTPDLDDDFTSNIPGERKAGESVLTFKDKRAANESIRDILAEGTAGVMIYMPYGDIPTERCECWPVVSGGVNDQIDLSSFANFQVSFGTPEPPEQNAVIPAAV